MAGSLASINIRFAVNLAELSTQMQSAARQMKKVSADFTTAGQSLTFGLTAPILGLGGASIKTYGDLQALQKGLISVMGTATAAELEFEKLKEVAKLPGLGLEEAVRGSVNLQAAGFSADEARASLLAFGNALATVGKGKRELDLVTLALTQLNNKSTGFGQDLRQLTEQLPQLRGALTAAFGTADSELIAKTGVTGKQVVQMLTQEFSKLPKVTGGINNAFENLSDSTKLALGEIGEAINNAFDVEGKLSALGDTLAELAEYFKSLSPAVQKTVLVIGGVAAAIGPVLLGIGAVLKIIPLLSAGVAALSTSFAFLTANILPIAAALGVAFLAYKAITNGVSAFSAETRKLSDIQKLNNTLNQNATKLIVDQKVQLARLFAIAKDETQPRKERIAAIKELNKISPEYLGNLNLETINTDKATIAVDKYNEALLRGAKARAAQDLLKEFYDRQLKAQRDIELAKGKAVELEKDLAKSTAGVASLDELRKKGIEDQVKLSGFLKNAREKADKQEEAFLLKIINDNKDYLKLLETIGIAETKLSANGGPKFGTIEYYTEAIKKLKEMQDTFETSPAAIAVLEDRVVAYQAAIDKLQGKRVVIKSVFEGLPERPESLDQGQGSVTSYDTQIEGLRKLQGEVATTSDMFYELEFAIQSLELEKEIKFDIDVDTGLDKATEKTRLFGQTWKEVQEESAEASRQFAEATAIIGQGMADAFDVFAQGIASSVGKADDGFSRFVASLLASVAKIVGALLSQSIASAIAGASSAAATTGVAAPVTLPVFIAEMVAAVIGAFAAIPKFETGGIVGGSSFYGDRILARVNSGELILNPEQQRRMYDMIEPAASDRGVAMQLIGEFKLRGEDLALALSRNAKKKNRTE